MFEIAEGDDEYNDNNDDDKRTSEHWYTISSPCEPGSSSELKTYEVSNKVCQNPRLRNARTFR